MIRKRGIRFVGWVFSCLVLCHIKTVHSFSLTDKIPGQNLDFLGDEATIYEQPSLINEINFISSLIAEKRYDKAVKELESLETRYPNTLNVCYLLAITHIGRKDWSSALLSANHCNKINVKWAVGHTLRGTILAAQKKFDKAKKAFDQAVQLAPQQFGVYIQRANFLVKYRNKDNTSLRNALADIDKGLELGATADITDSLAGLIYRALNQTENAEKYLSKALSREPQNINLLKELVAVYDETKRFSLSDDILDRAQRAAEKLSDQQLIDLRLIWAKHAILAGGGRPIKKHYQAALDIQPTNKSLRIEYLYWLDSGERLEEALPIVQEGLRLSPNDPYLTNFMAWTLANISNDFEEIKSWAIAAQRLNPDNPYFLDTMAWIEFRQGRYKVALQKLSPLLTYANDTPEIAYHAAAIYEKLGDIPRSLQFVRLAINNDKLFNGRTAAIQLLNRLK